MIHRMPSKYRPLVVLSVFICNMCHRNACRKALA